MGITAQVAIDCANESNPVVLFSGEWLMGAGRPHVDDIVAAIPESSTLLSFSCDAIEGWDTGLLTALVSIYTHCSQHNIEVNLDGLPEGAASLLRLAFAVEEREGARRTTVEQNLVTNVGNASIELWESFKEINEFVGELTLSFGRFFKGKANYLKSDLVVIIQEAGAEAFPIVSLISFLIGMIFAFVGVMQLSNFGAGIYTADLVAVAMVREMAPIMTAIIMAGRTGAAYAAQIGTMKVNEEIDALTTLGIDPIDFLALPRVIALIIMMPLLTMYSSLMGILGGLAVGVAMLDISAIQYLVQTEAAVGLNTLFGGLFKSIVYGSLVAIAGCMQGLNCGNNAMAVGQATTKAVVMGIVMIVVSAAILTVIYINIGI
jgi:phospholipid/cholesterol/gamma-HCH transport system permease protein